MSTRLGGVNREKRKHCHKAVQQSRYKIMPLHEAMRQIERELSRGNWRNSLRRRLS